MGEVSRTQRHIQRIQQYPGGPHGERVEETVTVEPVRDPSAPMRRLIISAVGFGLAAGAAQRFFGGEHWVWLSVAFLLWWAVQE